MKYSTFENIKIYKRNFLKGSSAFTLPGIGIFVGPGYTEDLHLLRHEFGHILQARSLGYLRFYLLTAPASLYSAIREYCSPSYDHRHAAVEMNANRLSYDYFRQPADWDHQNFPLSKQK